MNQQFNQGHSGTRAILRLVGPLIAIIGLILTVIGFGSFFSTFGSFGGMPQKFYYAFIGLPLLAVGIMITKFAFMGKVFRYVANETAPVAKDTINYIASGTKGAIRDIASAVRDGMGSANYSTEQQKLIRCHKCNEDNEITAKFCNNCGSALGKSKACPNCSELNDPDARFCDNCGNEIG